MDFEPVLLCRYFSGVHVGKDEMDVDAGYQGILFRYTSDKTAHCMPLTLLPLNWERK